MEAILSGVVTFAGTLAVLGVIEVAAETSSMWNIDYAANYFWSIPADPNGSEAERLAFEALQKSLEMSPSELCKLPYK